MKKQIIFCDICQNDKNIIKEKQVSVVFTTEQNEGRATKPYLETKLLDLCEDCYEEILKGKAVFGSGAMGYNNYFLTK